MTILSYEAKMPLGEECVVYLHGINHFRFLWQVMICMRWACLSLLSIIIFRSENIWVGLHEIDPRNGSKTQWVDCEDVSYTNFAPGSPYQVTDDRLCFSVMSSSGYWSTERCDQKFGFVCEETIGMLVYQS